MTPFIPRYVRASQTGALTEKIRQAEILLSPCTLCPRQCRVDRAGDEKGYCGTGGKAVVASFAPHFGEEPPLVGDRGSGTLFFSHCNLKCLFCQNYEISIEGRGQAMEAEEIASIMIYLQNMGCCNINLVTPSHVVPQILKALDIAAGLGLRLPLVYNSSGYDRVETLKILRGVVDIYMPDFKFWETEAAGRYCQAKDYPDIARKAVLEMQAQVGDLLLDEGGLALSGLLVRHLVMPGRISDTGRILNFLKEKVSPHTHVNLMSQYRPMGEAKKFKELSLPLSSEEFRSALKLGRASGLVLVR
jgi:putative pyruvate formate lyase activating enzyme